MKRRPKTRRATLASLASLPLLVVTAPLSAAEAPEDPREPRKTLAIVTSAVTPFFGAYYLAGEIRASRFVGATLNTSYLSLESGEWDVRAGTLGAGAEYYFAGNALRGWYAEAIGEIWFCSWRHGPSGRIAPLELGYAGIAIFGYQFVLDAGPVIDLGAGATAFHVAGAHIAGNPPLSSEAITRVYPAAKVDLGWAF